MKKVVRLTESDLEKIIRKVISEQMATGVAFGNEGNGFKMKREPKEQMDAPITTKSLKDLDDTTVMVFVDPFKGMDLVRAMAYLRSKGLKAGPKRFEVDPLTAKSFPSNSPQDVASDKIVDMVRSGLRTVAKNNYVDQRWFTKGFPIMSEDGRDISGDILEYYPNFYNILWSITQDQMKKV